MGCTESKADKVALSHDGKEGKRKSGSNKDKKKDAQPAPAAGGGGGIECFIPDDDTMATYLRYLDAVRQDAAEKGIMAPKSPTMGFPPTPVSPAAATPRSTGGGHQRASPSEAARQEAASKFTKNKMSAPERGVSVYCCRPLLMASSGEPVLVGKGLYSAVYLADLTLLAGAPENVAARLAVLNSSDRANADDSLFQKRYLIALKEVRLFARQRTAQTMQKLEDHIRHWARVSAYCPGLVQCIHVEQVFDESSGNGAITTRSMATPHASYHHVESLNPVHCYGAVTPCSGVSFSGVDPHEPAASSDSLGKGVGSKGKLFLRKDGGKKNAVSANTYQTSVLASKGKTAAALAALAEPDGAPCSAAPSRVAIPNRVRVYMEFQRYGSLRTVQMRHMPHRFKKTYLHELTARALMHDVLKTLAHLHAEDTLQYDVCASTIFVHHPLRAVYHTFFPAYISDLAAGDWRTLSRTQWKAAVVMGDPATDARGNYTGNRAATTNTAAASPCLGPAGSAAKAKRAPELSPAIAAAHAPSSVQHNAEPLSPLLLAAQQPNTPSMAVNLHDLQLDVSMMMHGTSSSPTLASPSSPGFGWGGSRTEGFANTLNNVSFVAAGLEALSGLDTVGSKFTELEWSNDKLKQYMETNGYEDCEGPPLPSPHDGAECQDDANQYMATASYDHGPTLLESQCVAAINTTDKDGRLDGDALSSASAAANTPTKGGGEKSKTSSSSAAQGETVYGGGGVVVWAPNRFPPASVASAPLPETRHIAPPQTLTADMDTNAFADLTDAVDLEGSLSVGNESFFVSEQLKLLKQHLAGDLQRRRLRPPITKLNHVATLRRVLAAPLITGATAEVPAHQYVSVAHAAPEALLRRKFTKASDIYAFAMTFIELVTPDGAIMADCAPTTKPKTRAEKTEYDETFYNNLCKWYNTRMSLLTKHVDAVAEEQKLPPCVEQPAPPPVVMPVPEHLSDECKRMLRWCLQSNPDKRPTAAQLLSSKYFLFGDWISQGEPTCPEAHLPEAPWEPLPASFEELAESAGLPTLATLTPGTSKNGNDKRDSVSKRT